MIGAIGTDKSDPAERANRYGVWYGNFLQSVLVNLEKTSNTNIPALDNAIMILL